MDIDKRYRSNEQRDHADRVSKLIILLYSHFVLCNGKPVHATDDAHYNYPGQKHLHIEILP